MSLDDLPNRTPAKVRVYDPAKRKNGWRVRWVIDGTTHRQATFQTKVLADRYRRELIAALENGLDLTEDGTSIAGSSDTYTVAAWARRWWLDRWDANAAKTRESDAEMIVRVVSAALTKKPDNPAALRRWILASVCARPGGMPGDVPAAVEAAGAHLERYSIRMDQISTRVAQRLWSELGTNLDGGAAAASTARRRRNLFNRMMADSVRAGVLRTNPVGEVERTRRRVAHSVDIDALPTVANTEALIRRIGERDAIGRSVFAYLTLMLHTGCRPSEAAALELEDCRLPKLDGDVDLLDDGVADGTYKVTFRRASPTANSRFTNSGEGADERATLKWRGVGEVRHVELTPRCAWVLAAHVAEYGVTSGRLFRAPRARTVSVAAAAPWRKAVRETWPPGHRFHRLRPYDMRHVHATALLEAGWDTGRVARRLGCSIDVLQRTYQGVLGDEMGDRERELMRRALG